MLKRLHVYCTLGNVLKELSEPAGAIIYTSKFKVSFFFFFVFYRNCIETLVPNITKLFDVYVSLIIHFLLLQRGDPTLSVLELWGAEYQESNALLLRPSDRSFLERVCQREKCPVDFVGNITDDKKVGVINIYIQTPLNVLELQR